ncbi:MAG: MBL fold metallo-hydrolase [Acidobacteriota bacterium]
MITKRRYFENMRVLVIVLLLTVMPLTAFSQRKSKTTSPKTQIVMLGTGTPGWDPDRSGPATAIVVNGTPYLVDFGPGVVRRAGAAYKNGIKALYPPNIRVAFLTPRHVDHTVGYSDLIFSPAQSGDRKFPLEVYGPLGTIAMTEYILKAHLINPNDERYKVNPHEITPGTIYKDENVTVKAFLVKHGDVQAFGYRFETPDRTIVISGDTTPTQSVIDNCHGCDVLIHEAYSLMTYNYVSPADQEKRRNLHTSTVELAEIALKAKPGLLILYHRSNLGGKGRPNPEKVFLEEIRKIYRGKVVNGHDLDVF